MLSRLRDAVLTFTLNQGKKQSKRLSCVLLGALVIRCIMHYLQTDKIILTYQRYVVMSRVALESCGLSSLSQSGQLRLTSMGYASVSSEACSLIEACLFVDTPIGCRHDPSTIYLYIKVIFKM